jgi:hypothetical protein
MVRLVSGPHYLLAQLGNRLYVGPLGLTLVPVFLALNQFVVRIDVILRNVHSARGRRTTETNIGGIWRLLVPP